jgi:hypothetical protein
MKLLLHITLLSSILAQFYARGENGNRNQPKDADFRLLRDRTASPISTVTIKTPAAPVAKPVVVLPPVMIL